VLGSTDRLHAIFSLDCPCMFFPMLQWVNDMFFHTLTSLHHVSKARSLHLCVPFVGSWTICLTAWITDARHTVLKVLLLIGSTGNEMAPITMVVWHPSGYKYLIRSSPRTISHSFPWFALGFPLSCPLFTINGGPKRH
jgi:hypothetical protein